MSFDKSQLHHLNSPGAEGTDGAGKALPQCWDRREGGCGLLQLAMLAQAFMVATGNVAAPASPVRHYVFSAGLTSSSVSVALVATQHNT